MSEFLIKELSPFNASNLKFLTIFPNKNLQFGYMGENSINNMGGFYLLGKAYAVQGDLEG